MVTGFPLLTAVVVEEAYTSCGNTPPDRGFVIPCLLIDPQHLAPADLQLAILPLFPHEVSLTDDLLAHTNERVGERSGLFC